MRVLIALLFSVAFKFAVYVYIDTFTQDIETKLGAFLDSSHPQYNDMLAIAGTVRSNHEFILYAGLVIDVGVCFGPLIVVLFLESSVMWGLRMFWGFVFHRYTIACAFFTAIYVRFF